MHIVLTKRAGGAGVLNEQIDVGQHAEAADLEQREGVEKDGRKRHLMGGERVSDDGCPVRPAGTRGAYAGQILSNAELRDDAAGSSPTGHVRRVTERTWSEQVRLCRAPREDALWEAQQRRLARRGGGGDTNQMDILRERHSLLKSSTWLRSGSEDEVAL